MVLDQALLVAHIPVCVELESVASHVLGQPVVQVVFVSRIDLIDPIDELQVQRFVPWIDLRDKRLDWLPVVGVLNELDSLGHEHPILRWIALLDWQNRDVPSADFNHIPLPCELLVDCQCQSAGSFVLRESNRRCASVQP